MVRFPQYLHLPIQVLDYEPDEMTLFLVMFVFAMVFGGWLLWIGMFVVPYSYRRFKSNYPRGFVKHIFWFIGLTSFKHYPIYFQKEFRE